MRSMDPIGPAAPFPLTPLAHANALGILAIDTRAAIRKLLARA